jgi:SAM-dependent methyltransferase
MAAAWGLPVAAALGTAAGAACAWRCQGVWRRSITAMGFPMSLVALGWATGLPAAVWLLLALPLLLLYPVRAWRDAPLYPTPPDALRGLQRVLPRAPQRVLDAGCGLGHGLQALHRAWPRASLHGVEWSWPLASLAAWRCRAQKAQVQRGDMWAQPWHNFDLVYLFQRPESMARAWQKAQAEMQPGAWLVSLEFAVPSAVAHSVLRVAGQRTVWVYQPVPAVRPVEPLNSAANIAANITANSAGKQASCGSTPTTRRR